MFGETPIGPEKRTYQGLIPQTGYRKVIVKEDSLDDYELKSLDRSQDFNWGYGGGGPKRLADALGADAFDDKMYGEAFGWEIDRRITQVLPMDKPFLLSRDRIVMESILAFNEWVRKRELVGKGHFMCVIEALLDRRSETRDRLMGLLSKNADNHLQKSRYGLR
ncbi:hypothetical protein EXS65_02105 [Candidatus Peribacteria bacterium]|nr:hypothetical protein [Candidatus Peribacteria bacterium]